MKAVILRPALVRRKSIYFDISSKALHNSIQEVTAAQNVFVSCFGENVTLCGPQKLTEPSIVGETAVHTPRCMCNSTALIGLQVACREAL